MGIHEQAKAALTSEFRPYAELKSEVDRLTGYQEDTNGAYQILQDLCEFGEAERHLDYQYRGGVLVGSSASFRALEQ